MLNASNQRTVMSQREREEFEQEKTLAEMSSKHNIRLKELELEVAKIEAKWSILLRLPLMIVRLPVLILFGIAFIVSVITKKDLPDKYWEYISK